MKFVNLTPHDINLHKVDGSTITVTPSGKVTRCLEETTPIGHTNGISIIIKRFGDIVNLPDPKPDTLFITSVIVAQEAWKRGRTDVFCPSDPVRDDKGKIVGCRSLARGE